MADAPKSRAPDGDPHRDLAGALHDVSNALTVLLGWVTEARAPDATPQTIAKALAVVDRRARMARDLARRAIGGVSIDAHVEKPLVEIVEEVVSALDVESTKAKVRLTVLGQADDARVPSGDVAQIVTNLVMNAMSHAPAGSEVRIVLSEGGGRARVDVVDDGPGVAEARRNSIFEGDSTRKGGAGVGLRHARSLARANGGDLALVESPKGAQFRLEVPLGGVPISAPPVSHRGVLDGCRVLIVEDDADVIDLLDTALTARGAEVSFARSAGEVATECLLHVFDAALVDLSPVENDVAGAIDVIRKRSPSVVVLFMTGNVAGPPESVGGPKATWVQKPFEVSEVVAALRAGLAPRPPTA
ncbi:MAG: hybrid sensor histidine kinase/response regulator [Polyangiaceae bacterium]